MPTLFGGAIELALPDRFEDISSYRNVPDNQEVTAMHAAAGSCQLLCIAALSIASANPE